MRKFTGALLLCFLVVISQANAKAPELSTQLLHARYVALGYETAGGFVGEFDTAAFGPGKVLPRDREALTNIREALTKWNRYGIALKPDDAELLIAIRSGRIASAYGGVNVHIGSIGSPAAGPVLGTEGGPANDCFVVYQSDRGQEGSKLWEKSDANGLAGKNPSLFEHFKAAVESAAKKQAARKP